MIPVHFKGGGSRKPRKTVEGLTNEHWRDQLAIVFPQAVALLHIHDLVNVRGRSGWEVGKTGSCT